MAKQKKTETVMPANDVTIETAPTLAPEVLDDVKAALTEDEQIMAEVKAALAADQVAGKLLDMQDDIMINGDSSSANILSSVDVVNVDTGEKVSLSPEEADKLRADLFGPLSADVEAQPEGTRGDVSDGAHAAGHMMGLDEFARSLDVDEPTEPSTIGRVQSWNPTHRIRTNYSVTPLMLKADEAFTFDEWINSAAYASIARVAVDAEGRETWERDGEPIEGVFKIES